MTKISKIQDRHSTAAIWDGGHNFEKFALGCINADYSGKLAMKLRKSQIGERHHIFKIGTYILNEI